MLTRIQQVARIVRFSGRFSYQATSDNTYILGYNFKGTKYAFVYKKDDPRSLRPMMMNKWRIDSDRPIHKVYFAV